MSRRLVFMFSGQGSQYYNMGSELFARETTFRTWMTRLDEVARDLTGSSVVERLYDEALPPSAEFEDILFTHPAVFMVEYAMSRVLIEDGLEPTELFGASLGEFVAAAVAGATSPETMLELVISQARTVASTCRAGRMVAVINNPGLYDEEPLLSERSQLAGVNHDSHFVLSMSAADLADVERLLKDKAVPYQVLPVGFAFHSSMIEPASSAYLSQLRSHRFGVPAVPTMSCRLAGHVDRVTSELLWDVVRRPMRVAETFATAGSDGESAWIDVGPGGTMAAFAKSNLGDCRGVRIFPVMTRFQRDLHNLEQLREALAPRSAAADAWPA